MRRVRIFLTLSLIILSSGLIASANTNYDIMMVTEFDWPNLPEGIAIDKTGNIYAGMAMTGSIIKISPVGDQSTLTTLNVGNGFLTGLAVDAIGNVFAALSSFDPDTHGVWRIDRDGNTELLASLPTTSFLNGLAFDKRGDLYVSDSFMGAIWLVSPRGDVELWLSDPLLLGMLPSPGFPIGANGIAFDKDGALFVDNTDFGRIVRVPGNPDGSAGILEVVIEDPILEGADGIAFDNHRNLYVAVNRQNTIVRITPQGEPQVIADQDESLDFPASLAFGTGKSERKNLFLTNFAITSSPGTEDNPGPSIYKIDVNVPGRPLP
ncbi:SMP-30/gluconolactonase/LRE family protein [[Eubacterium] cellulosolvens]